jgi:glycine/D-amino acid oxidase-like deaminating enzyme
MIGIQAKPRVAILGAGIMGSSAALLLARAGCRVTLIDQTASAMMERADGMKARSTSDSCTPEIHHAAPRPNCSLEDWRSGP